MQVSLIQRMFGIVIAVNFESGGWICLQVYSVVLVKNIPPWRILAIVWNQYTHHLIVQTRSERGHASIDPPDSIACRSTQWRFSERGACRSLQIVNNYMHAHTYLLLFPLIDRSIHRICQSSQLRIILTRPDELGLVRLISLFINPTILQ